MAMLNSYINVLKRLHNNSLKYHKWKNKAKNAHVITMVLHNILTDYGPDSLLYVINTLCYELNRPFGPLNKSIISILTDYGYVISMQ